MKYAALILSATLISACASDKPFMPRSDYPPDPWVKGYANDDDCMGGEDLAAITLDMPDYPRASYRAGRQGWVIVRLDVDAAGVTQNVAVQRSVPEDRFSKSAINAVKAWRFEPPKNGGLQDCRVLLRYRLGGVELGG